MVLSVLSHFAMKYELNIIILLFDIFQIIYNIDMKYLIDNVYHAPRRPSSRPQSLDFAVTQVTECLNPSGAMALRSVATSAASMASLYYVFFSNWCHCIMLVYAGIPYICMLAYHFSDNCPVP